MPFGKKNSAKNAAKKAAKAESKKASTSDSNVEPAAELKNEHLIYEDGCDRDNAVPAWETVAGSLKPRHSEVPNSVLQNTPKANELSPLTEETPNAPRGGPSPPNIIEDFAKKENGSKEGDSGGNNEEAVIAETNEAGGGYLMNPNAADKTSKSPTPIPDSVVDLKTAAANNKGARGQKRGGLEAINEGSDAPKESKRSEVNVGGTRPSSRNNKSAAKSPSRSARSRSRGGSKGDENLKSNKGIRKSDSALTEDIKARMLTNKKSSALKKDENNTYLTHKTRKTPRSKSPAGSRSGNIVNWNFVENRTAHFTSFFDDNFLIVRRGFAIKFSTSGDIQRLKLYNIPSKYSTKCNTEPPRHMVEITLTMDTLENGNWRLEKTGEIDYSLHVPTNCIIGLWLIKIRVDHDDYREDLRILFNPWCPEDEVYLEDETMRKEYVLNESGRVYTHGQMCYPWFFGQFEHRILDITLYLLDKSNLSTSAKCSAVFIARALCSIINHDDDGVINGRWQEPYTGGYDPKHWHSSVDILNRFYRTRKQISYGQCWVFSALLVTITRALGIPSRPVTNNFSFHDSNRTNICEWEIMHDGSVKSLDSVWNFHVWAEIWLSRNDLPDGYGGWQAIDPTPQEMAEGSSIAGPAPVKAIKEGAFHLPYDVAYLFSEMNSDISYWRRERDGQFGKLIKFDELKIGKAILTKQIGSEESENLISTYKLEAEKKEALISTEEKIEIIKAVNPGVSFVIYEHLMGKKPSVEIKLKVPEYVAIGNDFQYSAEFTPTEAIGAAAEAKISICIFVSTNVGKFIGQIAKHDFHKQKVSKENALKGKVEYIKYRRFACASYSIKIFVTCQLLSPNEGINCDFVTIPFFCRPPDIKVISKPPYNQGEPVDIKLSFINEFRFGLSGCYFELSAPRMKPKAFGIKKGLGSGESCYIHLQYKPKRFGDIMLIAKFGCREITVACGSVELDVAKKAE